MECGGSAAAFHAARAALRAVGKRSAPLNVAAREVAQRLADSSNDAARWVGEKG